MFRSLPKIFAIALLSLLCAAYAMAGARAERRWMSHQAEEPVVTVKENQVIIETGQTIARGQIAPGATVTVNGKSYGASSQTAKQLRSRRAEGATDNATVDGTVTFTYKQDVEVAPGRDISCHVFDANGKLISCKLEFDSEYDTEIDPDATQRTVSETMPLPAAGGYVVVKPSAYIANPGHAVYVKRFEAGETEIFIDASEAVNHLAPRMKDEQGRELELRRGHWEIEDEVFGDWEFVETAPGNAYMAEFTESLALLGNEFTLAISGADYTLDIDNPHDANKWDLWTNYVGPELSASFYCYFALEDKILWAGGSIVMDEPEKIVYNDPSTFYTLQPEIEFSPNANPDGEYYNQFTMRMYREENALYWNVTFSGSFPYSYMSVSSFPDKIPTFEYGTIYGKIDWLYDSGWMTQFYANTTPLYMPGEGFVELTTVDILSGDAGLGFPDCKWLKQPLLFEQTPYGSGPAFTFFSLQSYPYWEDESINIPYLYPASVGLIGGKRGYDSYMLDTYLLKWDISRDGERIADGVSTGESYAPLNDSAINYPNAQEYTFSTVNDNQTICGVPARTELTSNIKWGANPDVPTITAVSIHDAEGNYAYDLATAEGATLVVAGLSRTIAEGDIHYSPVTLTAEYAVEGTDDWKPLELAVESEFEKGLGTLALADLSGLAETSLRGMFNLRVTAVNADGSSTVNTITPAFRVASLSGIQAIESDSPTAAVYYDLTGRRVVNPASGIYLRATTAPDGLTKVTKIVLP